MHIYIPITPQLVIGGFRYVFFITRSGLGITPIGNKIAFSPQMGHCYYNSLLFGIIGHHHVVSRADGIRARESSFYLFIKLLSVSVLLDLIQVVMFIDVKSVFFCGLILHSLACYRRDLSSWGLIL